MVKRVAASTYSDHNHLYNLAPWDMWMWRSLLYIIIWNSLLFESVCYWTICSSNRPVQLYAYHYTRYIMCIILVTIRGKEGWFYGQTTWLVAIEINFNQNHMTNVCARNKFNNLIVTVEARGREGGMEGCSIIWHEKWAPLGIAIDCKLHILTKWNITPGHTFTLVLK